MTPELALVKRIVEEGGEALIRCHDAGITEDLLYDDGRRAYAFTLDHFTKYGAIPSVQTIEAYLQKGGVLSEEAPEPVQFYIDLILRRHRGNLLGKGMGRAANRLKVGDTEGAFAEAAAGLKEAKAAGLGKRGAVETRCFASIAPEVQGFVWQGRIPLGSLALIDGDPGLGKSLVTVDLAARLTRGDRMPDGGSGLDGPAAVLLLNAEDSPASTIRPRLEAAGADLALVHELRVRLPGDEKAATGTLTIPDDIDKIEETVVELGAVIVVLDPLMAHLSEKYNAWSDQHVRRALAPLAGMALRTGAADVVVRHLRKSGGTSALYRGGGSIGITGAARSALLVTEHPEDPERRVLAVVKSNLGRKADSLAFHIEEVAFGNGGTIGRVIWDGIVPFTADDLVAAAEAKAKGGARASAVKEAREFLNEFLADGPKSSKEVFEEATEEGHTEKTVRQAAKTMNLVPKREGFGKDGRWIWALPAGPTKGTDFVRSAHGIHPVDGGGNGNPSTSLSVFKGAGARTRVPF